MHKRIGITAGILAIPIIWFLASRLTGGYVIPEPWTTAIDTARLLGNSEAWRTIAATIGRVGLGFAAAFMFGLIVGVASVKPSVEYMLRPLILLMQGIPPILWSIPLILIMGYSGLTPVVVIAAICFPLVATTLAEGMRSVPVELREMLNVFAPGLRPRLQELILPHLRPFIAAAVRLGLGLGIKASVVAEYFAANNGIGFEVHTAYQGFLVRTLFSWALVLVLLILLADLLIRGTFRFLSVVPSKKRRLPESVEPDSTIRERIQTVPRQTSIDVHQVSYRYPRGQEVLKGVSLTVAPREIAVISGDSGVGKTTLLKIIAGILEPTGGSVSAPENLSLMFQDDRFLPWRNCLYNAALGHYYSSRSLPHALEYAGFFLRQVGLDGRELVYPDELSGGMKKRLSFARSFTSLPGALLLDEPFTGLHHEARAALWDRFDGLIKLRPVPVLIITHFPEEVPRGPGTSFFHLSGEPAVLNAL